MDKIEKRALKTGVDENGYRLHYVCPRCGWDIPLMPKRCPKCGAKRPKDAYPRALDTRTQEVAAAKQKELPRVYEDRFAQKIPAPKMPRFTSSDMDMVVRSTYATGIMGELGIPKYYTTDEYGRIYEAPVCYKPVGMGGPVPIAKPSKTIQTESVNVPLNVQ